MIDSKITQEHLVRTAYVYVRQSSYIQVRHNRESQACQYNLYQRAIDFGWDPNNIKAIDADLGKSATSTEKRTGFQFIAEEVAHGRVGGIFAFEVSRLARSSMDWHRLLELCGIAGVVIVDEQAVYNPKDYNDKLLLGLKGQFSEAEVYWMRLRTRSAALSKARRCKLRLNPPTGYIWNREEEQLELHPDEEIQRAIALLFRRFRIDGSARAVFRYFRKNSLLFPCQYVDGSVCWKPAEYQHILDILKNPIYAGTYVYGRQKRGKVLVDGEIRTNRIRKNPIDKWIVNEPEVHRGYITREEYMANQEKLQQNRTNSERPNQRGAPREGSALLQGLVLCGRCGKRMKVLYKHGPYYKCETGILERGRGGWSVSTKSIDEAVEKLFLEVMQPPELELSLAVTKEVEKQADEMEQQWKMRLERVRYESRQAERRYMAVDPDNRLVARTLENNWNEKLRELAEMEQMFEATKKKQRLTLSESDREEILSLARDFPRVWRAKSTSNADRKNLLQMMIEEIGLNPIEIPRKETCIRVMWKTGEVTELKVPRFTRGLPLSPSDCTLEMIRELSSEGKSDPLIASALNESSHSTGTGSLWHDFRIMKIKLPTN
jgi:DNA invertase Pin-like site-specific DNA recombinase